MILAEELRAGYRSGFGRRWRDVLKGVGFEVPAGSVTGYLGVNGAGKTTTIKVLVGINPPAGGRVAIDGHPAGSSSAQRLLGYFPEAPAFHEGLSTREHMDYYARLSGVDAAARSRRTEELLGDVGLADAADAPVAGFSKGMRQRLGLAQALVHDPRLLILDEPLDGLDPMGRLHLRELIAREAEGGRTVFFSSHVLSDVEAVCDRLILLDGGHIAFDGPTEELTASADPAVDLAFADVGPEDRERVAAAAGAALREEEAGRLRIACPDGDAAQRAVDAVRAAGGRILALEPRRRSLEAYFLERFGGGSGSGATNAPGSSGAAAESGEAAP